MNISFVLRRLQILSLMVVAVLLLLAATASAAEFKTTPVPKKDGKWRIGYYEGGPYFNYQRNLKGFISGLMELGWVQKADLPAIEDQNDTSELWKFAAEQLKSDYVEFVAPAYWSAQWDDEKRKTSQADCLARLQQREVDFMIVAGTWAGQDLANDRHDIPLTVFAVSDPVKAGIIKSPYESGLKHVHAKSDPDRYARMVRLFYNLFHFRRLGITYDDSEVGRAHAAVSDIEKVSKELGFEVVPCIAPFHEATFEQARDAVILCQDQLSRKADAVIIPVHRGVTSQHMSRIIAPLLERKIPTFSQQGSLEVKHGALMGITLGEEAFRKIGLFHAKVAASAFNGVNVGELPLIFEDPRAVAVNMETARRIGYKVPPGLLLVAEDIYETIAPDTNE